MKQIAYLIITLMLSVIIVSVVAIYIDLEIVEYISNATIYHGIAFIFFICVSMAIFYMVMPDFRKPQIIGPTQKSVKGIIHVKGKNVLIDHDGKTDKLSSMFKDLDSKQVTIRVWISEGGG